MKKQCKEQGKMNNLSELLSPEELEVNIKDQVKEISKELVDAVDAIEFYDEGDGEYNTITIDQLYNLPSVIASKENMTCMLDNYDNLKKLTSSQLAQVSAMSEGNTINIIKDTLTKAVISNLDRYFKTNNLITSLNLNLIANSWKYVDNYIEIDFPNKICLYRLIKNTLFDMDFKPIYSIHSDSQEGIENTNAKIELCTTQIYIYLSSLISFSLEDDLHSKINIIKIKDCTDFIKTQYRDVYLTMKPMFGVLKEDDALMLVVKQLLSLDLYNWFELVLKPVVYNVLSQAFKTNYFVYHDFYIDKVSKAIEDGEYKEEK